MTTATIDPPRPSRDDGEAKLLGLLGSPSRKAFMKASVVMELCRMAGRPVCEANDFLLVGEKLDDVFRILKLDKEWRELRRPEGGENA
jgi:hypothetical protein